MLFGEIAAIYSEQNALCGGKQIYWLLNRMERMAKIIHV